MKIRIAAIMAGVLVLPSCALLNVPDDPAYDPYNTPAENITPVIKQVGTAPDTPTLKTESESEFVEAPHNESEYDDDLADRKAKPQAHSSPITYWP